MNATARICFVCDIPIDSQNFTYNKKVNMPVCDACRGTEQEAAKVADLLEGLAEGFTCGCI